MTDMKSPNSSRSDTRGRRKLAWKKNLLSCFVVVMWFLACRGDTVATRKTEGDLCLLRNGGVGVCQLLTQCMTAVHKMLEGETPTVCSMKADMPIICCEGSLQSEAPYNVIQRQNPPGFRHEYYLTDSVPSVLSSADFPVRYPRGDRYQPWWLVEKPFFGAAPTTSNNSQFSSSSSSNNNNNNNHHPSPEMIHSHWWYSERPFVSAPPPSPSPARPPSRSPTPVRQTPKPITHINTTIRSPGQRRVSEIKCNEYSRAVTSQTAALLLVPTPELVHVEIPKCDFTSVRLIVGGEETELKEFPHMAALGYMENGNIDWKCGGSLISELYVLTAAHCTPKNNPPQIARLGDLNLKLNNEGAQPVDYWVEDIIRHPDYKPPAKYNDIALLKLKRHVKFNEFIRPACLYTRDTFDVNKTVATGWGKIDFAEQKSDTLLKVGISIIDNKLCNELYEMDGVTRELKNGIVPSMMCAGELKGGKDTCQGDSGGPIQISRPNNQCIYSIIGITSFGKFCAAKNAPGVYTRVSSFVPWIESIVWPE